MTKIRWTLNNSVALVALSILVLTAGYLEVNRDAGFLINPPRATPVSLELDDTLPLAIYVYGRCERHRLWITNSSGQTLSEFADRLALGEDHVCLVKTGLHAGDWTIHSEPKGLYISVFESNAAKLRAFDEWLLGMVQRFSLAILLLVGLRVAFQQLMISRKASTKGELTSEG